MPRGAESSNNLFVCYTCDYTTDRDGKLSRHFETEKHYIAVYGITCCGLTYHDKHRYVNHKKSEKHRHNLEHNPDITFKRVREKITLNLTPKNITPAVTVTPKVKSKVPKTVLDLTPSTSVKA
jgi:hypothetical protein